MNTEPNREEPLCVCFGVSRGHEFSMGLADSAERAGLAMPCLPCLLPDGWWRPAAETGMCGGTVS